ncbi:MAG TPA: Mth938-like domain-containing protein [Burkholderiaceae bacterium]|nr:Mth938-like domain-containing protein [Burkholderiaceae bacterium]
MKLHANRAGTLTTVTAYGPGWLEINAERYGHAVLVQPEAPVAAWSVERFEALAPEHFEAIARLEPEIVLLGTGATQRFPHPRLLAALAARRIGVEAMDTGAACRTYNILMTEGRRVLAALIPA